MTRIVPGAGPASQPRTGPIWKRTLFVPTLLVLTCVGIELLLSAADIGLVDAPRLRATFYENGGFWPGLLDDWDPNYSSQPALMFLTYGFLHGGLAHLGVNMVSLLSLGHAIVLRVGAARFVLIYVVALIGGGAGFGLLADSLQPMVGASGALFGLAGALLAWNYIDRYIGHMTLWPVGRVAIYLILINLVLWWAMDGQLAWQTHLGGFVSGWIMAFLVDPRARQGV